MCMNWPITQHKYCIKVFSHPEVVYILLPWRQIFFYLKKWSPGFLKVFQSVSVDIHLFFFYLTTFKRMIFVCQAT